MTTKAFRIAPSLGFAVAVVGCATQSGGGNGRANEAAHVEPPLSLLAGRWAMIHSSDERDLWAALEFNSQGKLLRHEQRFEEGPDNPFGVSEFTLDFATMQPDVIHTAGAMPDDPDVIGELTVSYIPISTTSSATGQEQFRVEEVYDVEVHFEPAPGSAEAPTTVVQRQDFIWAGTLQGGNDRLTYELISIGSGVTDPFVVRTFVKE